MKDFILLVFCVTVALIAIVVIYGNRKKTQIMRNQMKEPTFGNRISNNKIEYDSLDENDNFEQEEDYQMIDPVVEGGNYSANSGNKFSNMQRKTVTNNSIAEKSASLQASIEIESEKIDLEKAKRAEKFFQNDLITITIMSQPDKSFAGYELLQALLSAGLRFGKMNIFHRHEQFNGSNCILFSLASGVKPGIFEMPKMGAFSSPALVLFMQISTQQDVLATFELMINTAQQIAEDLGGEVCDQQRQILTEEKIAEMKATIAEYEQSKDTSELFA